MRIVFIGASPIAVMTARTLVDQGHEVVMIEKNPEKIEELRDELDCGFIRADGSKPGVLEEVSPENIDFLFTLSDSDQDNILASLVAQSLEVGRIITKIEDDDYEPVCSRLGLRDTIIPDRGIARSLAGMVAGHESPTLSGALEGNLGFVTVVARASDAGPCTDLDLPEGTRVVAVTRDERSHLPDAIDALEKGDRVLLLAPSASLAEVSARFEERGGGGAPADSQGG